MRPGQPLPSADDPPPPDLLPDPSEK
jgi:hypothetical protein